MIRQVISSRNVASIGYDPQTFVLEVAYHHGGKLYQYQKVPPEVYRTVMAAQSIGRAINTLVKPYYQAVPVPTSEL